ncbi:MAG: hypothetical protein ACM3JJ_08955 [Hyphomicrobiales bacterium]
MSFKEATRYGGQALGSLTWREYAPFAWMLAIEVAFLILGFNLGAPWGMGTAGALAAGIAGEGARHYPGFFVALPVIYSYVDAAVYSVIGAALIPLAVSRMMKGKHRPSGSVASAIPPTLIVFLLVFGLLYLWQLALPYTLAPAVRFLVFRFGFLAPGLTWFLGSLVGFAISALSLYVPIVAIGEGAGMASIARGIGDGLRLFWTTFLFLVAFSLLPLIVQGVLQANGASLTDKLRPEVVGWILVFYAILASLANFYVYAAAVRLHASAVKEDA